MSHVSPKVPDPLGPTGTDPDRRGCERCGSRRVIGDRNDPWAAYCADCGEPR